MAIFFAFLTLIGWGVGDVFVTIASRRIGNLRTFFWGHLFSLILISFYIPFAPPIVNLPIFVLAFFLGMMNAFSTLYYFRGLEIGNASLVGTIAGSFTVITVLLSLIIFREKITFLQTIGIILTISGVILASFKLNLVRKFKSNTFFTDKSVLYAFIPMIAWGIYFSLIRIPAEKIGWFWSFYPLNFVVFILILLGMVKTDALVVFKDKQTLFSIVLFTVLIAMAMFSYNLGLLSGFTSIVAPIAGASPVLFVILARLVFKEKLSRQQSLGIVFSLLGIVLISSSI